MSNRAYCFRVPLLSKVRHKHTHPTATLWGPELHSRSTNFASLALKDCWTISSDIDICSQVSWMLPQEYNQPSIINPVSPAWLPQCHWILVSTPPCRSCHCESLYTSPDSLSFFILPQGLPRHPLRSLLLCLCTLLQTQTGFFRFTGTCPSTSLISAQTCWLFTI